MTPLASNAMRYAGFWSRAIATLVDVFILLPFILVLSWALPLRGLALVLAMPLGLLGPAYHIWFHARSGQTPGKRFAAIRVVSVAGERISWREAALRSAVDVFFALVQWATVVLTVSHLSGDEASGSWLEQTRLLEEHGPAWSKYVQHATTAWGLSELVFLLFNAQRRSLHDFIAGTVVVHEPLGAPAQEPPLAGSI
jgi:uncharacterized RDD family membrane protein YckC